MKNIFHLEAGPKAFGDGAHPTTRMVLAALQAIDPKAFKPGLACDMGAGSGILSLALVQKFDCKVLAVELERQGVETIRANARANGMSEHITALHADGFRHETVSHAAPFDLIVMNILAEPLLRLAPDAVATLAGGGVLIISGILKWQESQITEGYAALGLELTSRFAIGDWVCLVWQKA